MHVILVSRDSLLLSLPQNRSPPNGPMPLFPAHSTADLGADLDLPLSPLVVTSRRRWSTFLGRQPEVLRGARV